MAVQGQYENHKPATSLPGDGIFVNVQADKLFHLLWRQVFRICLGDAQSLKTHTHTNTHTHKYYMFENITVLTVFIE